LVLVATTNFIDAVDEAVLSRADLVMNTTLPDDEVVEQIVASSLTELAEQWTGLKPLAQDADLRAELAKGLRGLDGRRIRKSILAALTLRAEVALDPERLTADDLRRATQLDG
ncbi:ATP-binding protein, partial [Amycolatopsis sp. NPDC023774]